MNWISRKVFLYKVTFGLYVLEWWEQCLFNLFLLFLVWIIFQLTSSCLRSTFFVGGSSAIIGMLIS
ncbi:unnamed protein product [Musa acuminata subsp. burmannicoides]